ncbi:AlpA family transcriptional regulator [Volucribacter psittacicida]|uniref:AlpA family transcriptional regulator n=1 Tax=Volucribacter psittacicida TaxID=203482 RepID=A0A4R1FVT4_9PAST|nr:AlpA family transcriptional regulator [Volucribacter psittacicida]TCJ97962.1 AlpA family transcriptional regulator [Volucribacter psittacicida]
MSNYKQTHKKEKFIRLNEVIERTGLSKATIYNYMKQNKFPKSIPLYAKSVAWLESEIDNWINNKIKNRENKDELSRE